MTIDAAQALAVPWVTAQLFADPTQRQAAPLPVLPDGVRDWLASLRLLEGVPFAHLVADDRLLPPESVRFFYLDRNWTDALVQGALSVGAVTAADRAELQTAYPRVRDELDTAERQVRVPGNEQAMVGPADVPTGFLLRSRAVSGWPALHVRAYRTPVADDSDDTLDGPDRLHLLRLERLAPAVLLAIFDGVPATVHVEEPRTGLQFGVDLGPPPPPVEVGTPAPVRGPIEAPRPAPTRGRPVVIATPDQPVSSIPAPDQPVSSAPAATPDQPVSSAPAATPDQPGGIPIPDPPLSTAPQQSAPAPAGPTPGAAPPAAPPTAQTYHVLLRDPVSGADLGGGIAVPFRAGAPGVIDMAALRDRAATALALPAGSLTVTGLVLQLLRFPYRQVFGEPAQGEVPFSQVLASTIDIDQIRQWPSYGVASTPPTGATP